MIRRPPRSTLDRSSAASDVYKRKVLAQVALLQRAEQGVGAGLFLRNRALHVALAVVAREPAALPREPRHLAVIDHHRQAILVDPGLLAFAHHLIELRIAVDLPLLAVEAQVLVLSPG